MCICVEVICSTTLPNMYNIFQYGTICCLKLILKYVFPFLAVEISTWLDHTRPAANTSQPEELPGAWPDGSMVRIRKTHTNISSYVTKA